MPPKKAAKAITTVLIIVAASTAAAAPYTRTPDISIAPAFRDTAHPSSRQYTTYGLKQPAIRQQAIVEVKSVTGADSFIARSLRVITGNGGSKIFETITGEDGLTFGIKDFTSDAVFPLLKLIEKDHPGAIKEAFGADTKVLENGWLAARKSTLNDHGLVAFAEVRSGLDKILCDPRFHAEQLARYQAEAVDPTVVDFKKRKFKKEFSLAAMIGAANSGGSGGLTKWMDKAIDNTHSTDEEVVVPEIMRVYTMHDAVGSQVTATTDLLDKVFRGKPGALPSWDALGHSARRLRWIAEYFSWKNGKNFTDLGYFGAH